MDPASPLVAVEQVRDLPGLNPRLFEAEEGKPALDALLSTHPKRINVNTASPVLLEALWPNPVSGRELLRRRNDRAFEDETELREFLRSLDHTDYGARLAGALSTASDFFRVSVTPASGRGERLTALVHRGGGAALVLLVRQGELETRQ